MNTYTVYGYTMSGTATSPYTVQAAAFTFNDEMVMFLAEDGRTIVAAVSLGLTPIILMTPATTGTAATTA